MFGYVNLYKPLLKDEDFSVFKAYYCGLCKELGRSFNQAVRLGLSYDFTFLALVLDSLNNDELKIGEMSCSKHFGKKRKVIFDNEYIMYSAAMSVALNYYKLTDDIYDDKSIKAFICRIPYLRQLKKIDKVFDIVISDIEKRLDNLKFFEKNLSKNIDEVSHEFAKLMETVFSYNINLKKFGYNLGKFIYIIDAFDDIDNDLAKKRYNPILLKYNYNGTCAEKKKIAEEIDFILTFTLSQIASEYEKLKVYKNKNLIDNIIYYGLRQKKDIILHKGEKLNEKPL